MKQLTSISIIHELNHGPGKDFSSGVTNQRHSARHSFTSALGKSRSRQSYNLWMAKARSVTNGGTCTGKNGSFPFWTSDNAHISPSRVFQPVML